MNRSYPYRDRHEAGEVLGRMVTKFASPETRVLALPRGGVPVGLEVARAIHAPLDVFIVRKLGLPEQPELAMGAIASGDVQVLNENVIAAAKISTEEISSVAATETAELHRREVHYRRGRPPSEISGKRVLLVDDGLATGASMLAAITAVRRLDAESVIVCEPVGARATCDRIAEVADELVCPMCLEPFYAVGAWYENFSATSDEEVRACLDEAADLAANGNAAAARHDLLSE